MNKTYILDDTKCLYQTPFPYRKLTEKELNRLMDSVRVGMSDEEFMARFWYLRREQEPDNELLDTLKKKLTKNLRDEITQAKDSLLSGEISEDALYKKKFIKCLNHPQYKMLKSYYMRQYEQHYKTSDMTWFVYNELFNRSSYLNEE